MLQVSQANSSAKLLLLDNEHTIEAKQFGSELVIELTKLRKDLEW